MKIKIGVTVLLLLFLSAVPAYGQLHLEAVYPASGRTGGVFEGELVGAGFDAHTRASLALSRFHLCDVEIAGGATALALSGNILYMASGEPALHIIDISDPIAPEERFPNAALSYGFQGSSVRAIALNNARLFAAADRLIEIVDVANLDAPVFIDTIPLNDEVCDLAVTGDHVLAAAGTDGMVVIRALSGSIPKKVWPGQSGGLDLQAGGRIMGLTLSGNTAYAVEAIGDDRRLHIIDIQNPESPVTLETVYINDIPASSNTLHPAAYLDLADDALDIQIHDDRLYSADAIHGVRIIDVSDPRNPQTVATPHTPGRAFKLGITGKTAYVAFRNFGDTYTGVVAMDIRNPASPKSLATFNADESIDMAVSENTVFLADTAWGIQGIHLGNAGTPSLMGVVESPGSAHDVTTHDRYAYVAKGERGLQIIDMTVPGDPSKTTIVSLNPALTDIRSATVSGGTLYVAAHGGGIGIYDISNPAEPEELEIAPAPPDHLFLRCAVSGDYLYALSQRTSDTSYHLAVFDIHTTPAAQMGVIPVNANAPINDMIIHGTTAFLVSNVSLHILGIMPDSAAATFREQVFNTDGSAVALSVRENRAYIAVNGYPGQSTLWIQNVDRSQSGWKEDRRRITFNGYAQDIELGDDFAFVTYTSEEFGGIQVLDIAPPVLSRLRLPIEGFPRKLASDGRFIGITNDEPGVLILPVPRPLPLMHGTGSVENMDFEPISAPDADGDYIVTIANDHESDTLRGAVTFSSQAHTYKPKALIIAGGGPQVAGNIWDQVNRCANMAHEALARQGYSDSQIRLIDEPVGDLSKTIMDWAGADTSELIVYLVGHGEKETFHVNTAGDPVRVSDLDACLDTLQTGRMAGPVMLVYDGCFSGTFTDKLAPPVNRSRIVITSARELAFFENDGRDAFSYRFWNHVLTGETVSTAFQDAASALKGIEQQADLTVFGCPEGAGASDCGAGLSVGRGYPVALLRPQIRDVLVPAGLAGPHTADITAIVTKAGAVTAVIIPPDFQPRAYEDNPDQFHLTLVPDTYNPEKYTGTWKGFHTAGTYSVTINASLVHEMHSRILGKKIPHTVFSRTAPMWITQTTGEANGAEDVFEPDDRAEHAGIIVVNDTESQVHTFHRPGDEDWVWFYAAKGDRYRMETRHPSAICDAAIHLYDTDGKTLLAGPEKNNSLTPGEEYIEWEFHREDRYHVRVVNDGPTFGALASYELKVYEPAAPALFVAVMGLVKNMAGQPIAGIDVRALGNGQEIRRTATGDSGSFKMMLFPGTWRFSCVWEGRTYEKEVTVEQGMSASVEIILGAETPKADDPVPQPSGGGGGGGGCFIAHILSTR